MKEGRPRVFGKFLVFFVGLPFLLAGSLASEIWADPHTTILKKNNPVKYDSRDEIEGSGGVLNHIRIPHGCNGQPIKAMAVVFPNGVDSLAINQESKEEVDLAKYITGPVINVSPVQDYDVFEKIRVKEGVVLNHGAGSTDGTRAIHYQKGKLSNGNVGLIPFDASFPEFNKDSCIASLQVNMAIANYCTRSQKNDDRADVWIGHMTPLFDDPAVVVQRPTGFWPQLTVIRDLESDPLPIGCSPEGEKLVVTPAPHEIDEYLPISGYWPSSSKGRRYASPARPR